MGANEPMPDERLARLAADNEPAGDHLSGLTADEVAELVAEVTRLRAVEAKLRAAIADEHTRLSQELENEAKGISGEQPPWGRIHLTAAGRRFVGLEDTTDQLRQQLADVTAQRDEIRQFREMLVVARERIQTAHNQTAELGGHVVQLRAELAEVREAHLLSEAQLIEVTLERAEWRKQAQQHETVAKILRERIGQESVEWGVRIYDDDPDEAIESMSSEQQARQLAVAWQDEIEGSNPTAVSRTRYVGKWKAANDAHQ